MMTRLYGLLLVALLALPLQLSANPLSDVDNKLMEKATEKVKTAVTEKAMETLNINTATVEQLQQLKGVGPSKAQAIVDYRQANGKFARLDDLLKVKGVGPQLLLENKDLLGL